MKDRFVKPKTRSKEEEQILIEEEKKKNHVVITYPDDDYTKDLSDSFKNAVYANRKVKTDAPYVVGYGGFRKGVISEGFFGKSFHNESIKSENLK